MRPARADQAELAGTAPPTTAASEVLAHLNPQHEKQMGQVVALVARTGKGKVIVRETVGRRGLFAVYPWRLREREDRRKQIPTALLRALPWQGSGDDPGMPTGPDEKDENQQEIGL